MLAYILYKLLGISKLNVFENFKNSREVIS